MECVTFLQGPTCGASDCEASTYKILTSFMRILDVLSLSLAVSKRVLGQPTNRYSTNVSCHKSLSCNLLQGTSRNFVCLILHRQWAYKLPPFHTGPPIVCRWTTDVTETWTQSITMMSTLEVRIRKCIFTYLFNKSLTFISSTPLVPNLDSTSHSKRQIKSLASSDIFGSSGNFKHTLQLII